MNIICKYCGYVINRDKIINGQIVEEYLNIYGTRCPKCSKINKPSEDGKELTDVQVKMKLLRKQVLDKLKKKLGE
jgi:hypothetical protein